MTLFMLVGIPGSGKSTFAKEKLVGEYLSSDDLRDELGKIDIWDEMHQKTECALKMGKDVIYDATNIKKKDRKHVLEMAKKYDAKTIAYVFNAPYERCIAWNRQRNENRIVPEDVIKRMLENYEPPTLDEFDEIVFIDQ